MADSRHKRDTDARRRPRPVIVAGSIAALATGAAVVAGIALQSPSTNLVAEDSAAPTSASPSVATSQAPASPSELAEKRMVLSRSEPRRSDLRPSTAAPRVLAGRRAPEATVPARREKRWTTTTLNLWTTPGADAAQVGTIAEGKVVYWTGRTLQGRDEVVVEGVVRYVTDGYLSDQKPIAPAGGLSDAPCPDSSVEDGLADDTIRVYRAVCHAFPQVTNYIGWGPRSEHDTGHALDVMVYDDKALGDAIAAWAQDHASELNLYDIIWYDRIWTPVRASEGWRDYGDHGSATANHMDHVHIGTN